MELYIADKLHNQRVVLERRLAIKNAEASSGLGLSFSILFLLDYLLLK